MIFNETAKEKKLINETGGIDKAVERAGNNAGLKDYPVWTIEKEESFANLFSPKSLTNLIPKTSEQKVLENHFLKSGTVYAIDNRLAY